MFKPLFLLFKITGLCPSVSNVDYYLSATSFTVAFLTSAISYKFISSLYLGTLQSIVFVVVTPLLYLSFLVAIAKTHFHKQEFLSIYEALAESRNSVSASYYSEVFQFFMLLVILSTKTIEYFHANLNSRYFIDVGTLYFSVVASLQHMTVVRRLDVRFSGLNDRLRAVAAKPQTACLSSFRAELLELLREHALLRRLIKHVNSYFAFNTLCGFFTSLAFLITDVYSLLIYIKARPEVSDLMIHTMVQTGFLLVYKIEICHRCSNRANESVMIVHRMIDPFSPTELMDDVELFSLAQFKNPVALTAAGVFNLNRGLITKAGAASLSYLIVALQLRPVG